MAPQERDTGRNQGRRSLLVPQSQSQSQSQPALTPTRRRLQQRKSHSPYPKGSPRTPVRRLAGEASRTPLASSRSQPTSPQSPGMRALSSILGFLSPFAASRQAKGSAAFGEPEENTTADDEHVTESQQNTISVEEEDTTQDIGDEDADEDEEMDTQDSIYPPLPGSIATVANARPPLEETPQSNGHKTPLISPPPRQSVFTSQSLSLPRHSTPSKTIFGAPASPSSHKQVLPPSAPSFTFGRQYADNSSSPVLPAYPRTTAKTAAQKQVTSPLAKNYDLLARFFAEKAEQEARGHGGDSSISLQNGEAESEDGEMGLTEIEVAGCLKLIEESLAQGRAKELDRLRGDALGRVNLLPATPNSADHLHYSRGAMSRSPSLPLGATAGEMSGTYGLQSRPSSSFLSPAYPRSDDTQINRSLASAFSTASASLKRRHRPLYLGPGQGASAASSLLRRNQQMQQLRRGQINRLNAPLRSPGAPSWQREEADPEDRDASGNRVKRRRMLDGEKEAEKERADEAEDEEMTSAEPQQRSLSASQSMPSFAFRVSPVKDKVPPPKPVTPAAPPIQISSPARTATADAMLSILSAGPSIPIRRAGPKQKQGGMDEKKADAPLVPEVVNPYQTRSRLTKRSSLAPNSTSLAAKEKERLKEERERKQKSMEEAKKRKESTLEMIERTAPGQGRKTANTRRYRAAEEVEVAEKKKAEDEQRKKKEQQAVYAARKKEEEERETRRANEEQEEQEEQQRKKAALGAEQRRKQTEEVRKRMDRLAEKQPPSSQSSTSTEQPSSPAPAAATASNGPRKSFTFGSTFAPKKPSPLSQADNMAPESPSSVSEKSEREGSKLFPSLVSSAPSTGFSFTSPSPNVAPAPVAAPKTTEKSPTKDARQEALSLASSSLPKFDFTASVLSSAPAGVKHEASRLAQEKAINLLPSFDLFTASKAVSAPPVPTLDTPKAAEAAKPAAPATPFSFAPSTAASSISSTPFTSAPVSTAGSDNEAENGTDAATTGDGAASALLSGTGEGEEDEDCQHEVRSKVWSLKEGKWIDLGIGLFKIKKNKSTGKKRILVRNEGNGKVMVNFHLASTFKPIKDKNVVSFLGFDASGKPTNYRCKVKTGEMADELETALQREAAA